MSELHTYQITYSLGASRQVVDVRAFTAADAVEQWSPSWRAASRERAGLEAVATR